MSESKSPEDQPQPSKARQYRRWLRAGRTGLVLAIGLSIGGVLGWRWLEHFILNDLSPLVSTTLSKELQRPVEVGPVKQFSWNSLQFGRSRMPPTPQDPAQVTVQAIAVDFNLLQLLSPARTLNLHVKLESPNLYLQQDQRGRWIAITLRQAPSRGPFRVVLSSAELNNGVVRLVPRPLKGQQATQLTIKQANGQAWFLEQNQRIRFQLQGTPTTSGHFALSGEFLPKTEQWHLQTQARNLSLPWLAQLLKLPLHYQTGRGSGEVEVRLQGRQLPSLSGTAQVQDVGIVIPELPRRISNARGQLRFQDKVIALEKVTGRYGLVPAAVQGAIDLEKGFNLVARVNSVEVNAAQQTIGLKLPFPTLGQVAADLKLTGPFTRPLLAGTVHSVQGLRADKVELRQASAHFQLLDNVVTLTQIQALPMMGGRLSGAGQVVVKDPGQLALKFRGENLPGEVLSQLYLQLPFPTVGQLETEVQLTGNFTQPLLTGTMRAMQTLQVDKVNFKTAIARFHVLNTVISLDDIQAVPQIGGRISGRGTVRLAEIPSFQLQFQGERLPGDAIAQLYHPAPPMRIGPVAAQVEIAGTASADSPADGNTVQTLVQWQAPQATYPAQGTVAIQGEQTFLRNTSFQVAGGIVGIQGVINPTRWQATADLRQIQLQPFSPDLRGALNGTLQLAGTTSNAGPATTQATGTVLFSRGLALVADPITAQVRWDGDKIRVQEATAPGFRAQGSVFARLEGPSAPELTGFDLKVLARDYNLKTSTLTQDIPYADLKGRANFTGHLTGSPTKPVVAGTLSLSQFNLNGVAFDPVLTGQLQYDGAQGTNLQLAGSRDRLALQIDAQNRPLGFRIQRHQATAVGKTQGDLLQVQVRHFPLEMFEYPQAKAVGLEPISGLVQADVAVNWAKMTATGKVSIAQPRAGALIGDRFTAKFQYADNVVTLSQGEFQRLDSQYLLNGRLNLAPQHREPQLQANVEIAQGQIQDILTLLQWYDFKDVQRGFLPPQFAKAAAVQPNPIGLPAGATLQDQLRRFSEILALQQQQQAKQKQGLQVPSLTALEGKFQGQVQVVGSLPDRLAIDFDLQGKDWHWDTHTIEQLEAKGRWENNELTLQPVQLQSDHTLLTFAGKLGSDQQAGDLLIRELPLEEVQKFLNLPVQVVGSLNGTAKLSGSLADPQAEGEVLLRAGKVNNQPLQSAQGTFKYADARLSFKSQTTLLPTLTPPLASKSPLKSTKPVLTQISPASPAQVDPILIDGNIPLPLPFAKSQPDNQQIYLDLKVQDEGLSFINLVNSQVSWVDGKGQLDVQIRGTVEQPVATGIAQLEDATFQSSAFPEPLQAVTGTIRFDNTLVQVEQLRGEFSQGQVSAQGVIPLASRGLRRTRDAKQPQPFFPVNPLIIDLAGLNLNVDQLYRGGVSGQLIVTGSVLEPVLGGDLALSNGQVFLPDTATTDETLAKVATATTTTTNPSGIGNLETEIGFANLGLNLGDRLQITGPLINFIAKGDLKVNGSLSDPRPVGTVELVRGQVNVYTTLFTLDRSHRNTAVFTAPRGLDPILNVHMVTSVPEVTRTPLPESPLVSSEIALLPSTSLGVLETVRIQAIAKGPASQLLENLELKSSPARTSNEIIALLGGGFVTGLGPGDSTLAIANLAGSALLTNVQAFVGQTFGISEFRIFPALIPRGESKNPSTIDIAAEAGFPLTRDLSASLLGILTSRDPQVLFNLRYRISDEFQMRGSTDFDSDSQIVLEFEKRF